MNYILTEDDKKASHKLIFTESKFDGRQTSRNSMFKVFHGHTVLKPFKTTIHKCLSKDLIIWDLLNVARFFRLYHKMGHFATCDKHA